MTNKRIITLDLDNTIVKPRNGAQWPSDKYDYEIINRHLFSDYDFNYVIVSNQASVEAGHWTQSDMIDRFADIIRELPKRIVAAYFMPTFSGNKAIYVDHNIAIEFDAPVGCSFRKPDTAIISLIEDHFSSKIVKHCGDREEDRLFALRAAIDFELVK